MANSFKLKTSRNIGTSITAVGSYTVPANTQCTAIGLTLSNVTTNTINVSASIYDGSNDTSIVKNATVVPGGTLIVIGGTQKMVIETGMSIRVVSSAATSVDAILSILEIS